MDGELAFTRIAEQLLFPPAGPLLLALAGLLLLPRHPRSGRALAGAGLILLLLASLPITGRALLSPLERHPPLTAERLAGAEAQAIVILGGGRRPRAPEYGGATVSATTLERVRYGARLQKLTGLPVVVSGGKPFGNGAPEAELMRRALREFGVADVLVEGESRNTAENARLTARLLGAGKAVLLVTHASHMGRAVGQFMAAGMQVIAAPTGFTARRPRPALADWLPSGRGLGMTSEALHEWVGRLWYALRY